MNRYFSSFFISAFFYALVFAGIFYFTKDIYIKSKANENISSAIALNHILIKKVEEKKIVKKEGKKAFKKIEKKQKKTVKKLVKKRVVKKAQKIKKPIKKEKIVKEVKVSKPIQKAQKKVLRASSHQKVKTKIVKKIDVQKEYLQKNLNLIGQLIQKKIVYPRRARRFGIEDIVKVKFILLKSGAISNLTFIKGHRLLKKATSKAVDEASKYFPRVSKNTIIELPIKFKLI